MPRFCTFGTFSPLDEALPAYCDLSLSVDHFISLHKNRKGRKKLKNFVPLSEGSTLFRDFSLQQRPYIYFKFILASDIFSFLFFLILVIKLYAKNFFCYYVNVYSP